MLERRKKQLRMDGVDPEKIQGIAQSVIENLREKKLSIQESQIVINEVGCALTELEKRSPETLLNTLPIQYHL